MFSCIYICFIPEYTFSHVCSIPKCAFSRYSPPSEEINCTPNKTYIDHLLTGMLCKCVDSVRSPGCRQNPCGWTRLTSLCPLPCLNPHIWTTLLFLRKWGCPGQMVLVYSADVRVSPLSLSLFPHSYCWAHLSTDETQHVRLACVHTHLCSAFRGGCCLFTQPLHKHHSFRGDSVVCQLSRYLSVHQVCFSCWDRY